ncbi:MAG: SPFH domain-containing protein [Clostridiales bacterium]|jgi:membrane protease subunit (stomatin/prohibitin family)|nr:SPFH domain-containing protein [Clostridiales bacterium]
MGIFDKLKRQLPKVIEWSDESSNTIVYRYPITDREEIMQGSQLTVRESQKAIFVAKGQIADVFEPGKYKLHTDNLPILTRLFSWGYAFESPYKGEIYFVNTKQFINQPWGTPSPIPVRDKDFGMARIRARGTFSFRVNDPAKLMRELSGTGSSYKTEDVYEQLKQIIVHNFADSIGEAKIPVLDLAANYREFGAITKEHATADFDAFGIEVTSIFIEGITLPDEVSKALDSRTSVGMFSEGDMNKLIGFQTAQAIPEAAKNPGGGGMAAMGVGMGMGFSMMKNVSDALNGSNNNAPSNNAPSSPQNPPAPSVKCYQCGAAVPAGSKFCGVCGAVVSVTVKCLKCGAANNPSAKFCNTCGEKLGAGAAVCKKCGAALGDGARFCPECGAPN